MLLLPLLLFRALLWLPFSANIDKGKNSCHYLYGEWGQTHAAQESSIAIGPWDFECFVGIVVILRAMSTICFIRRRQQKKNAISLFTNINNSSNGDDDDQQRQ